MKKAIYIILIVLLVATIKVFGFSTADEKEKNLFSLSTENIKIATDQELSVKEQESLVSIIIYINKYLSEYTIYLEKIGYSKEKDIIQVSKTLNYNYRIFLEEDGPLTLSGDYLTIPRRYLQEFDEHPAIYSSDVFETIASSSFSEMFTSEGYTEKTFNLMQEMERLQLNVLYDVTASYLAKDVDNKESIKQDFKNSYEFIIKMLEREYTAPVKDTTSIYAKASDVVFNRAKSSTSLMDNWPGLEDLVEYIYNEKESKK